MISYDNLWKTMKEKGISQYALIKHYNISPGQITRLKRNESVSTHTIEMFCKILKCNVSDSLEYKAVLKKINSVQEILDSCNVYNDLSQYYMQLIAEKSVIAAAECDEQRRSTLQNIKKLLMSL